jgi:hypothetical protein
MNSWIKYKVIIIIIIIIIIPRLSLTHVTEAPELIHTCNPSSFFQFLQTFFEICLNSEAQSLYVCTTCFNIKELRMLPTQCIFVLHTDSQNKKR